MTSSATTAWGRSLARTRHRPTNLFTTVPHRPGEGVPARHRDGTGSKILAEAHALLLAWRRTNSGTGRGAFTIAKDLTDGRGRWRIPRNGVQTSPGRPSHAFARRTGGSRVRSCAD